MVFHENTPIDRIYYGSNEVMKVVYNGQEVWTPTEYPSEEAQFEPDEHHPVDPLFDDYYGWSIYLRVDAHNGEKVKFPYGGTSPAQIMGDVYPMVVYDFYGQDWESHTGFWDDTYRLSKDQVVEYGSSIPQDCVEVLNANPQRSLLPATPKIEGVGPAGWSISYSNGVWNDGNKLLTELYIGDYAADFGFELGHHAFYNSTNLKNIRLPRTLDIIDHDCFSGCSSLKIADLRNCEYLTAISHHAFENCSSLEKVILPRLSEIHCTAFKGCSNLQKIVLLAETPPEIVLDQDGSAYGFEGVSNDLLVKVKPDAVRAYRSSERWNVYDIQPYTEEDFVWIYEH